MRVLVIEDEPRLAQIIAAGLRREGLGVDIALDGTTGLRKAQLQRYAVVVLDRNLPGTHGDEICAALQRQATPPRVLMLTALSEVDDRVQGLILGADDYLGKPFAFTELLARVHALARRPSQAHAAVLHAGDVHVDPIARTATRHGKELALRPREIAVLSELIRHQGIPVTCEQLLERVWDENADPFTNVVRQTVMRLRRQLGDPPLIDTVPGGYVIR